jgi:uncharacterized protein (TIGR03435 family)
MNRPATLAALLGLVCFAAAAQRKSAFEAVSIKAGSAPTPQGILDPQSRPVFHADAARVEIRNFPLLFILARAFEVQPEQVIAPNFARDEYFDIQATLPAGAAKEQVPEMLRQMFAERFKLIFHRETRDYQDTVVTVGKGGMKLARLPDDAKRSNSRTVLPDGSTQTTMTGKLTDLFPVMGSFGQFPHIVDETGLDGRYAWVRYEAPVSASVSYGEASHESFRNMLEAAGLKLEMRKAPKETIVVDHIERAPTEN